MPLRPRVCSWSGKPAQPVPMPARRSWRASQASSIVQFVFLDDLAPSPLGEAFQVFCRQRSWTCCRQFRDLAPRRREPHRTNRLQRAAKPRFMSSLHVLGFHTSLANNRRAGSIIRLSSFLPWPMAGRPPQRLRLRPTAPRADLHLPPHPSRPPTPSQVNFLDPLPPRAHP